MLVEAELELTTGTVSGGDSESPEATVSPSSSHQSSVNVDVKTLPRTLQAALKSVGYGRSSIKIKPATEYRVQNSGGDGERAFAVAVDLVSGQTKTTYGSWGGSNMFSPGNQVDRDSSVYPLPLNGAVITGTEGGNHPVFASITVHPENLQKLLPSGTEAQAENTPEEIKALQIIKGIKGGYRADEFRRKNLGKYSAENPLLQGLNAKGLIKITGVGIQITTAGRNVAESHKNTVY